MNFKKLAIVVLTILVNNIGYTNPERAYIIQQQVCTVINPVLLDTYNNTVHKQNTEAKFKRNNYNVNNSRNNNAINQINVTKLLNITSNNSKVGIKSSNNNYYGNILNLNKQLNVSKSSSTTSNDSKEKEDSKQIKEIPWKWVAEKDLSKYHNIAFKKMFSDKYFNGMSYSDFIKNYTVDDITKEQQVVLKKAAKWAAIRVKKDETLEEIMPIKKFLNSMKKKTNLLCY